MNTVVEQDAVENGRHVAMRRCAVTRARAPQRDLLRLALAPDGTPFVDLLGRAPGRGVYVVCAPEVLLTAVSPRGVGRAFKGKARPMPEDEAKRLVEETVERLTERMLELSGIARRAGRLEVGLDAALRMAARHPAGCVVAIASDASARTRERARAAVPEIYELFSPKASVGARLGRDEVALIGIRPSRLAERWVVEARRRAGLTGDQVSREV